MQMDPKLICAVSVCDGRVLLRGHDARSRQRAASMGVLSFEGT